MPETYQKLIESKRPEPLQASNNAKMKKNSSEQT